jgi:Sec-independent protein translocase protein TatA
MNFLGIGPLELVFIGLLLLVIFGPKDLQKAGKSMGQTLRKIVRSDMWKSVVQTSKTIKDLPNELIREADLDEIKKTLKQTQSEIGNIAPPSHQIIENDDPPNIEALQSLKPGSSVQTETKTKLQGSK